MHFAGQFSGFVMAAILSALQLAMLQNPFWVHKNVHNKAIIQYRKPSSKALGSINIVSIIIIFLLSE